MEGWERSQGSILDIRTTRSPTGVAIIAPCGELDASNGDRFRATVQRLQHQVDRVVIDLRGLTFMGVIGVHVLYAAWQLARKRGNHLSVIAPEDGEVRKLLDLSGLDRTLDLVQGAHDIA